MAPRNSSRSSWRRRSRQAGRLGRAAHEHPVGAEGAVGVHRRVRLGDDVLLLLIGGEVEDLVGDLAVDDLAVGRLDEAELVDTAEGGQRTDQADVRTFRGLDGAHAPVVAEVHVAHLEARPLTREAAGAERREPTTVGQPGQRVDLVHELAQLGGSEELLDRRDHRSDVDQGRRSDGLDVLGGHALAHDPLHAGQTDADLVLDQLADAADAAVGEVVLIVEPVAVGARCQVEQVGRRREDLAPAQHRLVDLGHVELAGELGEQLLEALDLGAELAVQLVAADPAEVVAARFEEGVVEVVARRVGRGGLSRTSTLVDLDQRLLLGDDQLAVLLPLAVEEVEVAHEGVEEARGSSPRRSPAPAAA